MTGHELNAGRVLDRIFELVKADPAHAAGFVGTLTVLGTGLDLLGAGSNFIYSAASAAMAYFLSRTMLATAGFTVGPANRFWPYFGLGILSGLGTVLGLVLLIVPGIIVFVRWLPAYGILIAEDAGVTDSLRLSWQRTAPAFWPLLTVSLIYGAVLIVGLGSLIAFSGLEAEPTLATSLPLNLFVALSSLFSVCLGLAAYLLVGPQGSGNLEEVFA